MRPALYTGALLTLFVACSGVVEAPDEGAGSSTGVAICSSNVYWKDMDKGSEFMHPGGACKTCHAKNKDAPLLAVAGTVYPTMHEPDECNGVGAAISEAGVADVTIVITDRTGRTLPALPVNSVGNFLRVEEVIPPFNVKVVSRGKENKMMMQAPHGDCNACHTQNGDTTEKGGPKPPGRITIPQ